MKEALCELVFFNRKQLRTRGPWVLPSSPLILHRQGVLRQVQGGSEVSDFVLFGFIQEFLVPFCLVLLGFPPTTTTTTTTADPAGLVF